MTISKQQQIHDLEKQLDMMYAYIEYLEVNNEPVDIEWGDLLSLMSPRAIRTGKKLDGYANIFVQEKDIDND